MSGLMSRELRLHAQTFPAKWIAGTKFSLPTLAYRLALLVAVAFFCHSLLTAGPVWDEPEEFAKLGEQLSFALSVLSGATGQTFHALPGDHAFYGVGTTLPPYTLSYLVDVVWLKRLHTYDHSYSTILHILTFLFAIAAASYTRRLVSLVTDDREAGLLAGAMLLFTPFWIGNGFFDYKDIPVATGVVAATYYAAAYWKNGRSQTSLGFFAALLFVGLQKLSAIPLVAPACFAVLIAALGKPSARRFAVLVAQSAICLALLYIATPPSWLEPIDFAITSLTYMSQHDWPGCTLTAGECIGRGFANGQGYSVPRYLALWYGVKLPLLIWIGLVGSIFLYCRSVLTFRPGQHLVVAALMWPILAISIRGSTLYDGIRHTLFLVPLAVSAVFVILPGTFWRHRGWLIGCYFCFLAVDSLKLQPYQYVWFNEVARFFANETNFETDYWGYSLREAAKHARALQGPTDWIVAPARDFNPFHLVGLSVHDRFTTNADAVPPGDAYYVVKITRMNKPVPEHCDEPWYVTRRELLAPTPLRLSFVAKCGASSGRDVER